ncbi:MAG: PQQ-binding-like beta-propeller repeat protein, partial [Planctomycetota bacterium]
KSGTEIINSPTVIGENIYFSAAEKGIHLINFDGKLNWQRNLSAAVYGTPTVGDEFIYVGDLEGLIHAIDRRSGDLIWSKRHAQFSIEQQLMYHNGVLYFGAWDGFVYAVDARDGSLVWKQRGPAGQSGERKYKSRYYAPADCPTVIIGDCLFVTDRAYRLGSYALSGDYIGDIDSGIAAIGPSEDGRYFYARGLKNGLTRYDANGRQVWSNPVSLGRFPIPPTEVSSKVYVCSNLGMLTVHDAVTGKILWRYQVTPQLHVMAPTSADKAGNVYIAAMDGNVSCIAFRD